MILSEMLLSRCENASPFHASGRTDAVQLTYPSITSLPTSTPIPFTLHVVTVSPRVSHDDEGTIWPSPPSHPREVLAEVEQRVTIRIGTETRTHAAPVASMWGDATDVGPFEKEWIPSEGDATTGRWRQEMTLRSSFALSGTPSFSFSRDGSSEVRVEVASFCVVAMFGI